MGVPKTQKNAPPPKLPLGWTKCFKKLDSGEGVDL